MARPIHAQELRPPALPKKSTESLCESYIKGYCSYGVRCSKDHSICHVSSSDSQSRRRPRVAPTPSNALSANPYFAPATDCFEDDRPGDYPHSPFRHDNDHVYIRDIQILPTIDEILSLGCGRRPYMPRKSPSTPHFFQSPPDRLFDTLFRQLRYDATHGIMDSCYMAAQMLAAEDDDKSETTHSDNYQLRHDTPNGNRYFLFRDVNFEELIMHERKGLFIRMSYACPRHLRGRRMFDSGHFEQGMLCALVGLDDDDHSLSTTFLEVELCQSTDAMKPRGGTGLRASVQLSFADLDDTDSMRRMVYYAQSVLTGRFCLLEFPKTLVAGFSSTLKRLQQMQRHDIAFAKYIAPYTMDASNAPATEINVLAPAYTAAEKYALDFNFLLRKEAGVPLSIPKFPFNKLDHPTVLEILQQTSTLDAAQSEAFLHCLTREMAFVQGPPGTGKSYLGIAIVQAILAAKGEGRKPVLAVCMTNHALDSFLGGLVDKGLTKIARIGSGSKEDWTEKYALRNLRSSARDTPQHILTQRIIWEKRAQALFIEIKNWCEGLSVQESTPVAWFCVKDYLQKTSPDIFRQLRTGVQTATDMAYVRAEGFAYEYWAKGGDLKHLSELQVELQSFLAASQTEESEEDKTGLSDPDTVAQILREINQYAHHQSKASCNIWALPLERRRQLIAEWRADINLQVLSDQLVELHRRHRVARENMLAAIQEENVNALKSRDVIGCTTTGAARYWDIFNRLNIDVVICEEAGEVMEAHTLCTLFPSVEHAIFIGDPLQLRPQVAEHCLSLESEEGSRYRLDESLFERLMIPKEQGLPCIPTAHLRTQRRMHPDIAALAKVTLYPYLEDHPSTFQNPQPVGVAGRLHWYDHRYPEDIQGQTKSRSNSHEVAMVAGAIGHLVSRNEYALGEIAVLTPYSGQLAKLYDSLRMTCSVWLNKKDRQTLLDEGLLSGADEDEDKVKNAEDVMAVDMLRVATIDNFQGEEARIVILSTVRSESGPGFLRVENRINVGCTRARDGFYIFGNSETLSRVPMWREVIDVFREKGSISPSIRLTSCARHLDHYMDVWQPSDFSMISECSEICGLPLDCGHICGEKCHSLTAHTQLSKYCSRPCIKPLECFHVCPKRCSEDCGRCTAVIGRTTLPCGHKVDIVCSATSLECNALLEGTQLACGHRLQVSCSQANKPRICRESCRSPLPCGHTCSGKCADCSTSLKHQPCESICNQLLPCGHRCNTACHPSSACPPCNRACLKICAHGNCKNKCGKPCEPCMKIHKASCVHQGKSDMLCCLPSDLLPCSQPCTKVLVCGHLCRSLCGEPCSACIECSEAVPKGSSIYLPECGHSVSVETLDEHMSFGKYYKIDENGSLQDIDIETLPETAASCVCGQPTGKIRRYTIITELLEMEKTLDQIFAKIGGAMDYFGRNISKLNRRLDEDFQSFCQDIRPNPLAGPENTRLITKRQGAFTRLSQEVVTKKAQLVTPLEKSLHKLREMIRGPHFPQYCLPFGLRLDLLALRVHLGRLHEWQRLASFLTAIDDPSEVTQKHGQLLLETSLVDCKKEVENCEVLIEECEGKTLPCLEVELRLHQLLFHGLHARCMASSKITTGASKVAEGGMTDKQIEKSFERLSSLTQKWPDTAGGFTDKAQEVQNFVDDSKGKIPKLYGTKTLRAGRAWGTYALGALRTCQNGHPYSGASFKSCPECGKKTAIPEDDLQYEACLVSPEAFMACTNKSSINTLKLS